MNVFHLKPGDWYLFHHKSPAKGSFYARYIREYTDPADEADPMLVEVDVWTGPGSSQERLANSMGWFNGVKQQPMFSTKRLRPSQLESIDVPSKEQQAKFKGMSFAPVRAAEYGQPIENPVITEVPAKKFLGIFRRKVNGEH